MNKWSHFYLDTSGAAFAPLFPIGQFTPSQIYGKALVTHVKILLWCDLVPVLPRVVLHAKVIIVIVAALATHVVAAHTCGGANSKV